jgi:hypothetical protein
MINIYSLIFYLYVVIFLSGYYPRFFFTRAGVGMGQNIYPSAGVRADAGKILRHG